MCAAQSETGSVFDGGYQTRYAEHNAFEFADFVSGSAASRPDKRIKLEMELEPASFTKRVSHPPFARGAYNSEEWVFDDEDDDDVAAERDEFGDQDEPRHYSTSIPDDGIRSLEVLTCCCFQSPV